MKLNNNSIEKVKKFDPAKIIFGGGFLIFSLLAFFSGAYITRLMLKKGVFNNPFIKQDPITQLNFEEINSELQENLSSHELPELRLFSNSFNNDLLFSEFDWAVEDFEIEIENDELIFVETSIVDYDVDDRYSIQINIIGNHTYLGMHDFRLHDVNNDYSLEETAFHYFFDQVGFLPVGYQMVYLYINDRPMGLVAVEESLGNSLISDELNSVQLYVKYEELQHVGDGTESSTEENQYQVSIANLDIPVYSNELVEEVQKLFEIQEPRFAEYQKGNLLSEKLFDLDLLGKYYAVCDLWGISISEIYFYLNQETNLFEPVFNDVQVFSEKGNQQSQVNSFTNMKLFDETIVRISYAEKLAEMVNSRSLEELKVAFNPYEKMVINAFPEELNGANVSTFWNEVAMRQEVLRLELTPYQHVHGMFSLSENRSILEINLVNSTLLPVEVLGVFIGERYYSITDPNVEVFLSKSCFNDGTVIGIKALQYQNGFSPPPIKLSIDLQNSSLTEDDIDLSVLTRFVGLGDEIRNHLLFGEFPQIVSSNVLPSLPNISELLDQHTFLTYSDHSKTVTTLPGDWNVSGDLLLPEGVALEITAGTILRFGCGNIIYSTQNIDINGEKDLPVLLTAIESDWGGIVVNNADEMSSWRFAEIENIRGSDQFGTVLGIIADQWILTSGLNFYQSSAELDHVNIHDSITEDLINFIHSPFSIFNSNFSNAYSDAIDADFSDGLIEKSSFNAIGGDAIDVSGSEISVEDVKISQVIDKGISAGEDSLVYLKNIEIEQVGIGIASKDLSEVNFSNVSVSDAKACALAAYIKKYVYGPAKISGEQLNIFQVDQIALVETGCQVLVDGEYFPAVNLDVDELYELGILGN